MVDVEGGCGNVSVSVNTFAKRLEGHVGEDFQVQQSVLVPSLGIEYVECDLPNSGESFWSAKSSCYVMMEASTVWFVMMAYIAVGFARHR